MNIFSRKTSACAMIEKYLNVRFHIRKVMTPSGYELQIRRRSLCALTPSVQTLIPQVPIAGVRSVQCVCVCVCVLVWVGSGVPLDNAMLSETLLFSFIQLLSVDFF